MSSEVNNLGRECPGCAGSGQISFFKGVSRFLISSEECPECAGLGYILKDDGQQEANEEKSKTIKKNQKSKTKKS
jgi:DnaJ-class molecular chaperone